MAWRIENPIETMVGATVLAAAAFFAYFASQAGGGTISDGYRVNAAFSSATGVTVGTDVRVAGVKVGRVSAVKLDQDTFFAATELTLRGGVQLPIDSIAKVSSENLLGGTFIALEPGIEDDMLVEGDIIEQTQGAADLLDLLQQFSGSSGGGGGASEASGEEASNAADASGETSEASALDAIADDANAVAEAIDVVESVAVPEAAPVDAESALAPSAEETPQQ